MADDSSKSNPSAEMVNRGRHDWRIPTRQQGRTEGRSRSPIRHQDNDHYWLDRSNTAAGRHLPALAPAPVDLFALPPYQPLNGAALQAVSVITHRQTSSIIHGYFNLTFSKLRVLSTLVDLVIGAMFPTADKVVNVRHFQLFIQHVFHAWLSAEPVVGEAKLPAHNFGYYSVPVGTLKQDAPITEGARGQGVAFLEDNYRVGQPVFYGITLNHEQEPVAFAWQDSQGRGISQRLIQFNRGMTVQQARYNVMAIYDENEIIRIG
ncbi:hypothetical protein EDB82DRAFT_572459 [Fusarium venenatum]|uniref:uncharacterized protein n=1 Tax=Fusarium venenatum TaxID=56646 RepID=UPI001D1FCC57|nr:hypothetical protein EDB82DRAFT_572459 [Fusarium venenatum]